MIVIWPAISFMSVLILRKLRTLEVGKFRPGHRTNHSMSAGKRRP